MLRGFSKYRLVYGHLWLMYGSSWLVRFSYILQFAARICKLIALPVAISLIITNLSKGDFGAAQGSVLLYVAFSLTLGVLSPAIKYIGMRGENKVYHKATAAYFAKLMSADIAYFNSNLSGYLTTSTRHYVDGCIRLIRALRDRYMNTLLSILFPLGVIIWLDWWLGLVALALSLTQAGYLLWASRVIDAYRTRSRELYKRNSGRMADIISNILAVKSTAQEQSYIERVRAGAIEESNAYTKRYTVQAKLIGAREAITVTTFMTLLWLTVQRMSGGHIDITAAVLVVTYTTTILTGIYSLSDDVDEHDNTVDEILPAFEILNRENAVKDPEKPEKMGKVRGEITLNNISFAYDEQKGTECVLKDFSLKIPAGQKVGIVGLSGAGKSTLARLLLRFNDVTEGEILLDGKDIRSVVQAELRKNMAYVPQEPLLFHTSVKDNILLSNPEASDEQVEHALKAAHAFDFVMKLPDGPDSVVGERGVKLSGGQKQRVVIARAVLQASPIMILDEATSALDSESEQIIKDSFAEILRGKTAIVIAHRLSTLSEMDRIVVIEKGKLVEDGTHESLLARKGLYARLWRRQLKHAEES